jgi:hypothetical protein
MEVNEIDQENLQTIMQDIINDQAAPVAQARVFSAQVWPPFADCNGRETTARVADLDQHSELLREKDHTIKDLQNKRKQSDEARERFKLKRKQQYDKRAACKPGAVGGGPPKKKPTPYK